MSGCSDNDCSLSINQEEQRKTLSIILCLNAVMFMAAIVAALKASSVALLSESFDYFGDALTYALSFIVINMSNKKKAYVALFKGSLIFIVASVVAFQLVNKVLHPSLPSYDIMGVMSLLGLFVNGICLALLWKHRNEDINMSSVWECSRNDIAANISVMLAALGVWLTSSVWPDIIIAFGLMLILYRSAYRVIKNAWREMQTTID